MNREFAFSLLVAPLMLHGPAAAQSVADFYRGKTVNFIVGFGPGGGYDLYPRVHQPPSRPPYPGQSERGGAEHGWRRQRAGGELRLRGGAQGRHRDRGGQSEHADVSAARRRRRAIRGRRSCNGSAAWRIRTACIYTWHTSGIKTIEDAKQREVPLGAVGTASDSYIFPTIVNALVGTRFKPIPGYAGTGQINIAIERGEVMGRGGTTWASVQSSNKSWLEGNKLNICWCRSASRRSRSLKQCRCCRTW